MYQRKGCVVHPSIFNCTISVDQCAALQSLLDQGEYGVVQGGARACQQLIREGQWRRSSLCLGHLTATMTNLTNHVDIYNVLYFTEPATTGRLFTLTA